MMFTALARVRWIGVGLFCLLLFGWQMWQYGVIQDDTYISLVYARHLASGLGLEFNPGERVEGYTNFLWTLLLVLPHWLGVDAPRTAQILGGLCGVGVLAAGWGLGRQLAADRPWWAALPAPVLLAANGALAYWSLSGLETSLFVLLVTGAAICYVRAGRLDRSSGLLLGLATLTRPEGALFALVTGAHQLLVRDRSIAAFLTDRQTRQGLLAGTLLVLPHLMFRLWYYGDIVPNTFHAKTGVSTTHLVHGLGYATAFLIDYGLGPLSLVAALHILRRRKSRDAASFLVSLYVVGLLYAVGVGGDTLAEKRLLLPVLPMAVVILQTSLTRAASAVAPNRAWLVVLVATLIAAGWTVAVPHKGLLHARQAMEAHNGKLHDFVDYMKSLPQTPRLVASTAIGIPRYFGEADVLDLVGLTDSTIARHPIRHPDIRDDHILRNYNTEYVMGRTPELIFFIAGSRPATPAERALFLSPRFRRAYVQHFPKDDRPVYVYQGPDTPTGPLATEGRFIELYSDALAILTTHPTAARTLLQQATTAAPADFVEADYWLGWLQFQAGQMEQAQRSFERVISRQPAHALANVQLASVALQRGDLALAGQAARSAQRLAPQSMAASCILGRVLLAEGDLEGAIRFLTEAAAHPGPHTIDAMLHLGIALQRRGNPAAARRIWEAILAADPEHAQARQYLRR